MMSIKTITLITAFILQSSVVSARAAQNDLSEGEAIPVFARIVNQDTGEACIVPAELTASITPKSLHERIAITSGGIPAGENLCPKEIVERLAPEISSLETQEKPQNAASFSGYAVYGGLCLAAVVGGGFALGNNPLTDSMPEMAGSSVGRHPFWGNVYTGVLATCAPVKAAMDSLTMLVVFYKSNKQ